MKARVIYSLITILGLLLWTNLPGASAADFYDGKTLRFVVGSAPGGGYDTYTRMIARHMSRYIPGNPAAVVENMEGAGGLVAANFIYKRATSDGLTLAVFNNSNIVQKALGDPRINIDFQKLGWIGAPSVGAPMCMIMGFTGLKTLDDVLKSPKPLKMGANRAGTTGYDLPMILNQTLGTRFDVISGYTGTAKTASRCKLMRSKVSVRTGNRCASPPARCWMPKAITSSSRSL